MRNRHLCHRNFGPIALNVLALSGSLRQASINTAFCLAAARLAPAPMQITLFAGLGALPLFNPDLETDPPWSVQDLRQAVARADALLIASPEYAHGISGVMKNALDWLVSDEGVVHKPVALVNTSPRAHHACDALREILKTMSTTLVTDASTALALPRGCVTQEAMLSAPEVRGAIADLLTALATHLTGGGGHEGVAQFSLA
ncbi:MAG: NAD(P)H-dependent oxidoreductase [Paucibacter sp.]|nr:NAD(P)H-dependent oxidoreductase [Roseateles sp.]